MEAQVKGMTKTDIDNPVAIHFRQDLHRRATETAEKNAQKKLRKSEKNRAVADSTKKAKAVQRAANSPLKTTQGSTSPVEPLTSSVLLDDAPALPILSRVTGNRQ